MLSLYHTTLHLLSFSYVVYLCQDLLTLMINGNGYLYDLTVRVNVNDTYLNSFNFFWTSFTYLPTFFFGIYFLHYTHSYRRAIITLLVGFLFYNLELVDMLTASTSLYLNDLSRTSINLLLLNSLNKYHPFIFYLSVYLILTLTLLSNFSLFTSVKHPFLLNKTLTYFRIQCRVAISLNLSALFMGSWWALQEGTWGGWWNWDPSEVFGLMFGILALWVQHSMGSYVALTKVLNKFIQLTLYTLLTYFFIQLNFDLVSHNFGAKFFFFFNNNLFFLEAIFILILSSVLFYRRLKFLDQELYHSVQVERSKFNLLPHLLFLTPFLSLILYMLTVFSFLPLINYFFWNFLGINTFNSFREYTNWVILFSLVLVSPFYKSPTASKSYLSELLLTNLIACITYLPISVYLITTSLNASYVRILHTSLVYFLFFNVLSSYADFILWTLDEGDQCLLIGDALLTDQTHFYACSNEFVYSHLTRTSEHNAPLFTSGVFYTSNSLTLQPFLLILNSGVFTNLYNLSLNWINSSICIESTFLNNTYDSILILLVFQWSFWAL